MLAGYASPPALWIPFPVPVPFGVSDTPSALHMSRAACQGERCSSHSNPNLPNRDHTSLQSQVAPEGTATFQPSELPSSPAQATKPDVGSGMRHHIMDRKLFSSFRTPFQNVTSKNVFFDFILDLIWRLDSRSTLRPKGQPSSGLTTVQKCQKYIYF